MQDNLKRGQILKSMAGVGGAVALSQLLAFLSTPILTRIYSQEAFGQFGLFVGLSNVLAVMALAGLSGALMAPPREKEASALLRAAIVMLAFMTIPCGMAAFALIHFNLFNYGELPAWATILVGLNTFSIGLFTLLQVWLARKLRYKALSAGHLSQGAMRSAGQLSIGMLGLGFAGLGIGEVATRMVAAAIFAAYSMDSIRASMLLRWRNVWGAVRRRRQFVIYGTITNVANNVGTALPVILVTAAFDVRAAGLFTLMSTVITTPVGLAQKVVGDVFIGHFAAKFRIDPVAARHFLWATVAYLAGGAVIIALVLYCYGGEIFVTVFGAEWARAGLLAGIMSPLMVMDLTIGTVSGVILVTNQPQIKLLFDFMRIAGMLLSYWTASRGGASLEDMAFLFAWTGVIAYAVFGMLLHLTTLSSGRQYAKIVH